jgi:hypothetical protein
VRNHVPPRPAQARGAAAVAGAEVFSVRVMRLLLRVPPRTGRHG